MTAFFEDDWPPWVRFQFRIKTAISHAASEHDTVGDLLRDLWVCEQFLRRPRHSVEELCSPSAQELQDALKTHAAEDSVHYDQVCAANIVRASMDAIATAAAESYP